LELLDENPYQTGDILIFYSENPDKPCSAELFRRNLSRALKAAAIDIAGGIRECFTVCKKGGIT
jgi:hypothetical protein